MIIKRKLFSKKLTAEEKRQRAADRIDETRGKTATAHGILAGSGVASIGLTGSGIVEDTARAKVSDQYIKHLDKNTERFREELDKINKTGDKVRKLAKKKLKKTGNPFKDLANELDINSKVNHVEAIYKGEAMKRSNAELDTLEEASRRLKDRITKKASKRNKKILAGAALVGTAVGIASNRAQKKRAEKLRKKTFSKKNPDEDNYLGMQEEFDDTKFQRKSDKWLNERARYDGGLTEREKKNIKKNSAKISLALGASGASIGLAKKASLKRGLIGAGIGAGVGAGIAYAGHRHHLSEARKAKKEIERRKKKKD